MLARRILCLTIASLVLTALPAPADTYSVGVASVDVTPNYPIRLSGFGFRRTESEGVTQPIYAKALAIGDDDPAVLLAVDNLGVPASMVEDLAKRLRKAGVKPERLAITSTHTHTAPMLTNVCPTLFGQPIPEEHQKHIDRYTRELADSLEKVALAALKDRAKAELFWEVGTVKFAANRRTKGGPVDHDLPMLVVKNPEGKIRAIYVSYACHCVTLSNNKISGDWAGYAADAIQRARPGAVAMVSIGCGADQNPNSGVTGDKVDAAVAQGAEIAREVDRLLKGILKPVTGELRTYVARFTLDFDKLPTRAEWEEKAKKNDATGYHAKVQLAKLDRGEKLMEKLPYSVQNWAFGDSLTMVFLPGEVVVDYSLRLKKELDPVRLWVNAYSNDAPCYIPSERLLKEGGYEGGGAMIYYDKPTRLKAGLEDKIIKAVKDCLNQAFVPPFDPNKLQGTRPLSPRQSEAAIKLKDGFVAELVAAEPLVQSPVAINWGPDGRLWVAEMLDYPTGLDGQFKSGGRVKVLQSTKGDGKYDKATVFLDNIPFPTGVTPWRKGLLVCAAPDILYAEDTKGTGKADVVKKLFSGFATHNYQARVNSLEYGLDGWVYGSGGLFGGDITSFSNPKPVPLANRDFRINPDTGVIEAAAGRSQYGRVRNDWGDWFGCDNSTFLRHYPLADHYLRRNAHVAPPDNDVIVTDYPDWNRVYPLRDSLQLFKLSGPPGRATAACGLGIYRDDLLGKEYTGNAFTCEPVNLLVHRLVLTPKGCTFSARCAPDEQQSEFLASTDNWFRPVQVRTGPDGALYVVDMYRLVIEHPRWIPPEELVQVDVRAGYNMGRIYRIYHKERPPRPIKRLDKLDATGLAAALDSPNGPQRDLAMQMLVWKQDKAAAPALQRLAASKRPEVRASGLCCLGQLQVLQPDIVLKAIQDKHSGVRRHAVRLCESGIVLDESIRSEVFLRILDSDSQVLLQTACTLGERRLGRDTGEFLGCLLIDGPDDPHLQAGILSSLNKSSIAPFMVRILGGTDKKPRQPGKFAAAAMRQAGHLATLQTLRDIVDEVCTHQGENFQAWQFAALAELADSLEQEGESIEKVFDSDRANNVAEFFDAARKNSVDSKAEEELRIASMNLLGRQPSKRRNDIDILAKLIDPQQSTAVQVAALTALAKLNDKEVPAQLLALWKGLSPTMRLQVLDVLLARDAWVLEALEGMEKGQLQPADFDIARRQRLLQHKNKSIRERAARLFAVTSNPDRKKIVEEYQSVTATKGDKIHGKEVFAKRCSTCHKLDGVGHEVGPDLGQMANKSPQAFLIAILDPNQAVDARYLQYIAVTKDGRQFNGILASETATSITIREQDGKDRVLLRTELEALESTGKSLMPEGLEKDINKQEMSDLVAYLTANAAPIKKVAGNNPAVVKPAADGTLRLRATDCEIHGGEITFESDFKNIGMWHGENDHVVWTVELDKPTTYEVYLDWACADSSAGNVLVLDAAGKTLRHRVAGTGGDWSNYKITKIGTITVRDGTEKIFVRPETKPQRALCDLRGLILVKEGGNEPKLGE